MYNKGKPVINRHYGLKTMACPRCLQTSTQDRQGMHLCPNCGFECDYSRPTRPNINRVTLR